MGLGVPHVPFEIPGLNLIEQGSFGRKTAPKALATQMAEVNLCHV
jgi:hypothetical protein